MRIYQKELEKFLNKSYKKDFNEVLKEMKLAIPGYSEIFLTESKKDELFGEVNIYQIYNVYEKSEDLKNTINEEEWSNTYDVFLEFWKIPKKDGSFDIH